MTFDTFQWRLQHLFGAKRRNKYVLQMICYRNFNG